MSVREDLAKILAGGRITSDSVMWGVADELLKAHARELAEEIRGFALRSGHTDKHVLQAYATAADLIDPEKQA